MIFINNDTSLEEIHSISCNLTDDTIRREQIEIAGPGASKYEETVLYTVDEIDTSKSSSSRTNNAEEENLAIQTDKEDHINMITVSKDDITAHRDLEECKKMKDGDLPKKTVYAVEDVDRVNEFKSCIYIIFQ